MPTDHAPHPAIIVLAKLLARQAVRAHLTPAPQVNQALPVVRTNRALAQQQPAEQTA